MTYAGSLSELKPSSGGYTSKRLFSLSVSSSANEIIAVADPDTLSKAEPDLQVYEASSLNFVKKTHLPSFDVGAKSKRSAGLYAFHDVAGSRAYVIMKGGGSRYAIVPVK